jgi:hypothetical protein
VLPERPSNGSSHVEGHLRPGHAASGHAYRNLRAGCDISKVPDVMDVDDLVDAALVGFNRKESVTIPPVSDVAAWGALERERGLLGRGLSNAQAAARYRS